MVIEGKGQHLGLAGPEIPAGTLGWHAADRNPLRPRDLQEGPCSRISFGSGQNLAPNRLRQGNLLPGLPQQVLQADSKETNER